MELGKRVRVTKGPHKNDVGTITQLIGNGRARRWRVHLQNDGEIDFHAKSLAIEAIFDGIMEGNIGDNVPNEVFPAENQDQIIVEAHEDEDLEENDEIGEELDDSWVLEE